MQIPALVWAKMLASPLRGLRRGAAEIGQVEFTDTRPIMIAGDANIRAGADTPHTLTRLRAVADHIAQAPELIYSAPPLIAYLFYICQDGP